MYRCRGSICHEGGASRNVEGAPGGRETCKGLQVRILLFWSGGRRVEHIARLERAVTHGNDVELSSGRTDDDVRTDDDGRRRQGTAPPQHGTHKRNRHDRLWTAAWGSTAKQISKYATLVDGSEPKASSDTLEFMSIC